MHHEGQDYLVPYDGSVSSTNLQRTLVPVDFADIFENSLAKTILFFIDACREGIDFGTKNIAPYQRWSHGKLKKVRDREVAHVFACQAGEVARYVTSEDGQFSLFSRALEEVVHKDCQATAFDEVTKALQQKLDELSTKYGKEKQTIRINTEAGVRDESLYQRTICRGPQPKRKVVPQKDIWRQAITDSQLWTTKGIAQNKATEKLKQGVLKLVEVCRQQWQQAESALPDDPWRDEYFPLRMLDRIEFLVSRCEDLELSVSETAILLAAPFVREAVLASAVTAAAQTNPYSMEATGSAEGFRGHLEKIHLSFPQLIRKIERLQNQKDEEAQIDQQAIATWLMYRCILRTPEVWMDPPGYIPTDLLDLIEEFKQGSDAVIRDTFSRHRLLEIARCINTDLERIERGDRPSALQREDFAAAASSNEQRIREKMLAYLINLAGWMAIDARMLSEALVDHVGLNDPLKLEQVRRVIKEAKWKSDGPNRVLKAICHHPATDLALQEHVAQASDILDRLQQKIHKKEDCLEVLTGLPQRLLAHEIKAEQLADGPVYETPHLQFQLSHNDVRELLMGESLYGDPTLAIRELYQNALDACRYREARTTYLQRKGQYQGDDWEGLIVFRQDEEDGRPYIECEDNGIGMGRRELTDAFSRAGRRFADMPEFIEEQAEWLRCDPPIRLYPNSQFGIGVFSYFMLADELLIKTCRLDRDGQPGTLLEVKVAGSGSLFRVRPMQKGTHSGTLIRLYLTEAITQNQQESVSCLNVLRELLRVAQFRTEVHERSETDVWMPGELKWPGAEPEDIIATSHSDVWWVKFGAQHIPGFSSLSHYAKRSLRTLLRPKEQTHHLPFPQASVLPTESLGALLRPKGHTRHLLFPQASVPHDPFSETSGLPSVPHDPFSETSGFPAVPRDPFSQQSSVILLVDGIITNQGDSCAVVNLRDAYKPTLKVDRSEILAWDKKYVTKLLRECNNISIDHTKWLTYEWLWALEGGVDAEAARRIVINLIKHNASVKINEYDVWLPIHEFGCTILDCSDSHNTPPLLEFLSTYRYIRALSVLKSDYWLTELVSQTTELKIPTVFLPGDALLLSITLNREPSELTNQILVKHLVSTAFKLNWSIQAVYERLQQFVPLGLELPKIDFDYLARLHLMKEDETLLSFIWDKSLPTLQSVLQLIDVALKLNWSIQAVYERLQQFVPLGLELPEVDPNYLTRLHLMKEDSLILSYSLDQNISWLEDNILVIQFIRSALKLNWSIQAVYERLQQFVPLGLKLPEVDPNYLARLHVSEQDQILLSRDAYRQASWLKDTISKDHLVDVALKLNWSIQAVYERLQQFVPLGLELPKIDVDALAGLHVSEQDQILLSHNLDGEKPFLEDVVSAIHVIQASFDLNWSIQAVYERLQQFVPLGLELPKIDVDALAGLHVSEQDQILLSHNLDGEKPFLEDMISVIHVIQASLRLNWSIQAVYERLSHFVPFGIELPEIDLSELDDVKIVDIDILLLSRNLDDDIDDTDDIDEDELFEPSNWLKTTVPIVHMYIAAKELKLPIEHVYKRFLELAPLGFQVPQIPLEQLSDLEPSLVELIVLSQNCTALPPYLDNVVSAEHFARAMCKIAIPAAEVLRRLQRFAPFGLVLPSLEEIEEASKR